MLASLTNDSEFRAALVGYTNAGKSSLLRTLSGADEVFVEDRLFATLDPLTREVPRASLAAALASLAVDRVFDAIVLLLLLFAALLDPAFPRGARLNGQSVPALARGGWQSGARRRT